MFFVTQGKLYERVRRDILKELSRKGQWERKGFEQSVLKKV